jgi:hypothetical protein
MRRKRPPVLPLMVGGLAGLLSVYLIVSGYETAFLILETIMVVLTPRRLR